MDYGVEIKKTIGNPNKRSAHYVKPSPFADSNRRIRGALLRTLGNRGKADVDELARDLPFARERVKSALMELEAEGFVAESAGIYTLGSQ
jgi:A/G-specific adenine glycosylase